MADMTLDDIIADLGTLEPHLAALASEVNLPDLAVAQCAMRVGEVAPALRAIIAKAADSEPLSGDEQRLLLRGIFILAGRRDTTSFPILLRLLRRPEAELVDLLDDVPEMRLASLLSGLFDGDAEALLGLARDAACADDVRLAAIEAAAFLTFDGRIPRVRMRAFLAGFVGEPYAKGDVAWTLWADVVARLGFRDLAPLVHAALAGGRIAKAMLRKPQFDKDLAAAEADPMDASPFADACYIADILEALEWTRTGEGSESSTAPIDVYLALLGSAPRPPELALRTCVARFEEAAPLLRGLLARVASGLDLSNEESLRFFRGLYVLAAVRDTVSCAPFLRFLRRPIEDVEDHLGDAVTASLPRLLISLFDGDEEGLLALAAERKLDEYVRGAALEAATYLAWEGRLGRERLRQFLVDFHAKRRAGEGEFVWYTWMMAIALLDLGDLVPRVEAAWKGDLIDHSFLDWSDFKMDLARARTAWDDEGRFRAIGYADDAVAELAWTDHDEASADGTPEWEQPSSSDMPVTNPFKNVGRNDPCPCGSGKKYKKCCLTSA